jgi:hypothetical protein
LALKVFFAEYDLFRFFFRKVNFNPCFFLSWPKKFDEIDHRAVPVIQNHMEDERLGRKPEQEPVNERAASFR